MAIRGKPNTDQFIAGKDPSAFLESGAADMAEVKLPPSAPNVPTKKTPVRVEQAVSKVQKEQKVFRLPIDVIKALKRESFERSIETDTRVTEMEIVELALRKYLKI